MARELLGALRQEVVTARICGRWAVWSARFGAATVACVLLIGSLFADAPQTAGSLSVSGQYGVGRSPSSIAAGDFNLDGRPDVVVTDNFGASASVLLGNGDGSLRLAANFTLSPRNHQRVAVADFNRDGVPDLVFSGWAVSVFLGDGAGQFARAADLSVTVHDGLVAADLTQDGIPDLFAGNANSMSLVPGRGDGSFQPPLLLPRPPCELLPAGCARVEFGFGRASGGDLNGDGRVDLVLTGAEWTGYGALGSVLLSGLDSSAGVFGYSLIASDPCPGKPLVTDLNADGILDIVTGPSGSTWDKACVLISIGTGDGTFSTSPKGWTGAISNVAVGDFNGDGRADLAMFGGRSAGTGVYWATTTVSLGRGDGRAFEQESSFVQGPVATALVAADFNRDGRSDLAYVDDLKDCVWILLGAGR